MQSEDLKGCRQGGSGGLIMTWCFGQVQRRTFPVYYGEVVSLQEEHHFLQAFRGRQGPSGRLTAEVGGQYERLCLIYQGATGQTC